MACVMRPRGAFVGEGAGLLDDLVAACQVQPACYGPHEVAARAQTLVPYFSGEEHPFERPVTSAKRQAQGNRTAPPARKTKRTAQVSVSQSLVEGPTAGPGFFKGPPSPEHLPLPLLLGRGGKK